MRRILQNGKATLHDSYCVYLNLIMVIEKLYMTSVVIETEEEMEMERNKIE